MEITRLRVESEDFKVGENGVAYIKQVVNQISEHSFVYRYCVFFDNGESYSVNIDHPYCEVWFDAPKETPSLSWLDELTNKRKK